MRKINEKRMRQGNRPTAHRESGLHKQSSTLDISRVLCGVFHVLTAVSDGMANLPSHTDTHVLILFFLLEL
jgi:hypothetical protein